MNDPAVSLRALRGATTAAANNAAAMEEAVAELLDELMENSIKPFEKVKIFVVTSSLDDRDKQRALSYPIVSGFLIKMITLETLKEHLQQ